MTSLKKIVFRRPALCGRREHFVWLLLETQRLFHVRNQTSVLDKSPDKIRVFREREGSLRRGDLALVKVDGDFVTGFDSIHGFGSHNDREPLVEGVAIIDSGEAL